MIKVTSIIFCPHFIISSLMWDTNSILCPESRSSPNYLLFWQSPNVVIGIHWYSLFISWAGIIWISFFIFIAVWEIAFSSSASSTARAGHLLSSVYREVTRILVDLVGNVFFLSCTSSLFLLLFQKPAMMPDADATILFYVETLNISLGSWMQITIVQSKQTKTSPKLILQNIRFYIACILN